MEYHLALHLGGSAGRNLTLIDMNLLVDYLVKIDVKRYVCCIEPATHDHLHCVYTLKEKRPNIKRDIIKAMRYETKDYPNNACYNKLIKTGQTFEMLAGGYLQKGYKFIKTSGISHVELAEGKNSYDTLVSRKTIKLCKNNLVRYIVDEMKEIQSTNWRETLIHMMRDKKYNCAYICKAFEEEELDMLIHFATTESSQNDAFELAAIFRPPRN